MKTLLIISLFLLVGCASDQTGSSTVQNPILINPTPPMPQPYIPNYNSPEFHKLLPHK